MSPYPMINNILQELVLIIVCFSTFFMEFHGKNVSLQPNRSKVKSMLLLFHQIAFYGFTRNQRQCKL